MEEEGASSWTAQEAELRQRLEQSLRENPADRAGMISLGTLLATKGEFGEAKDLLQRGSIGMANDPSAFELLRKLGIAHVALWKAMRIDPESASSINTSDARKTHLEIKRKVRARSPRKTLTQDPDRRKRFTQDPTQHFRARLSRNVVQGRTSSSRWLGRFGDFG